MHIGKFIKKLRKNKTKWIYEFIDVNIYLVLFLIILMTNG